MTIKHIDKSWDIVNSLVKQKPLTDLLDSKIYNINYQPESCNIFEVFTKNLYETNVVILGKEPYSVPKASTGRAFSISKETLKVPNVLNIIRKELEIEGFELDDINVWKTLEHWQQQGILLLNTTLTVETSNSGSHTKYWTEFSKNIINYSSVKKPCIWLLWGTEAKSYLKYISNPIIVDRYDKDSILEIPISTDYNYILTSAYPAAEAYSGGKAGFYNCNHFQITNFLLNRLKLKTIKF